MRLRLLVVDDDAIFRAEFAEALGGEGHEVAMAASVDEGIAFLEKRPFDAVFTDLRMPRQGGLELLRQTRQRWPHVHVIVVTGFATVETAVEAMKLGAFDYVQKPFRVEAVRRSIALVEQEIAFAQPNLVDHSPATIAAEMARREGIPVLLVSLAAPTMLLPGVHHAILEPTKPVKIRDAFLRFAEGKGRVGLVVADMHQVLATHTVDDVASLIRKLRDDARGLGPIAFGFDPAAVPGDVIGPLRAVLAAPELHGLVDALGSPIRRRALRRLEAGGASFSQLLEASAISESPKLSFHLHRLVDAGLVGQMAGSYRLTAKGTHAVAALHRLEDATTREPSSFMLFGSKGG